MRSIAICVYLSSYLPQSSCRRFIDLQISFACNKSPKTLISLLNRCGCDKKSTISRRIKARDWWWLWGRRFAGGGSCVEGLRVVSTSSCEEMRYDGRYRVFRQPGDSIRASLSWDWTPLNVISSHHQLASWWFDFSRDCQSRARLPCQAISAITSHSPLSGSWKWGWCSAQSMVLVGLCLLLHSLEAMKVCNGSSSPRAMPEIVRETVLHPALVAADPHYGNCTGQSRRASSLLESHNEHIKIRRWQQGRVQKGWFVFVYTLANLRHWY